ncbi:MAG: PqqD family protein [Bacteroides sp.]
MKIKENYKVRNVAGENLVVGQGRAAVDMTRVISLNASAVVMWNELKGSDFTIEDAAAVLVKKYAIAQDQALADARKWVDALAECNVIDA